MIIKYLGHSTPLEYIVDKFPDGQQQVRFHSTLEHRNQGAYSVVKDIEITTRLTSFLDVELLICAVASLRNLGVETIHLHITYFLGGRYDRQFGNDNHYIKQVIAPIINSLNFHSVSVLDPHSDVIEACLNNYVVSEANSHYEQYLNFLGHKLEIEDPDDFILISPDAGAYKKIYKAAKYLGIPESNIVVCSKVRDGDRLKVNIDLTTEQMSKRMVVLDDLCDGGGTFLLIAQAINELFKSNESPFSFKGDLILAVTHGIFSKGFKELNQYYDKIYCTNSYSDIPDYYNNGMEKFKTNVEQLEVI